ncbi:geranylgeranyl transferase type-2 subunit alpha [Nasonia vitripennis]|uniref:Geranylgeranyl transferase type-2 subunit alpha n=1 Tax=Nasonia vitripennis TaxID=7425 RepID=A0A7M7GFH1_NASVI|nr:geranylgeranyl transferase type-2 subunit alpha [Nasonia vitripennis]
MHGRVKVRTTAEQEKIKQAERQKKAVEFKKGVELVFEKRKKQKWDDEILLITEKLLVRHPDVYTLWNIRRETFLNNNWSDEERIEKLEKELSLTESSLRENPKSYCVWHQRTWVIEHLPNPNWKREIDLCNKCLNLDERNFHCWDYRRFIASKANVPDTEELEFTTTKILNNFSNYSSWHLRSKILQKLYPSNVHDLPIRADKHDEELDLVMNATFTDPNDSSAWFYHRWLLDYWKSPLKLWRAVLTKTTLTAAFHKEVPCDFELFLNDKKYECEWKSANGKNVSAAWYAVFEKALDDDYKKIFLKFEGNHHEFKPSIKSSSEWIYESTTLSGNHNNPKLNEQLENYQTLAKMEPCNKWARLTSIHLMLNINPIGDNSKIIKEFGELIRIDPLRANYYKDMCSKYTLYYNLNPIDVEPDGSDNACDINLSNLELTSISSQEPYLTFYREVNFSNNCIENRLHQLYTLQQCVKLDLSKNNISSIKSFPTLHNLRVLLLHENQINNYEEVCDLIQRHNLTKIDLQGNPFLDKESLVSKIKNISSDVEVVA